MASAFAFAPMVVAQDTPQARMFAPSVISTANNEFGGAISPDGRTLIFSSGIPHYYRDELYVSRRLPDGNWSVPQLAPFSRRGRNFDANFSPDGKTVLFASDRGVGPTGLARYYSLFETHQIEGGWSEPTRMPKPLNDNNGGPRGEPFATIAADGSIYFTGVTREGGLAIYVTHHTAGGYGPAEKLGPAINATNVTAEPVIAPNQSFLIFSALERPGGPGNWDIWISRRQPDESWGKAEPLGPAVNTPQRDYSPRLEPDGHTLLFTSERYFAADPSVPLTWASVKAGMATRQNGHGSLYEADIRSFLPGQR